MSGVFSMASHWALQYLPDVVTHEQTGCEHFSVFAESICFLLVLDQERMIQALILVVGGTCFCTERNILRYWLRARKLSSGETFSPARWKFMEGMPHRRETSHRKSAISLKAGYMEIGKQQLSVA
jgi:hypothetical protein